MLRGDAMAPCPVVFGVGCDITTSQIDGERQPPAPGRARGHAPQPAAVGGISQHLNFPVVQHIVAVQLHPPIGALAEEIGAAGVAEEGIELQDFGTEECRTIDWTTLRRQTGDHALHAYRAAGYDVAALAVDSENPTGALDVYRRVGLEAFKLAAYAATDRIVEGKVA